MSGWIKLHRKILDNRIWTSEPFSRGQAWVDLLLLANHEYGYFYLRDHKIEVQRGQVGYSQLKLSDRWMWSRTKVRKFLKDLEKEQQIIQQQSHSTSIITIINYEQYQEKEQQKDNRKTTERQQKDTNKKNKEEYKKNKEVVQERREVFKQDLAKLKSEFSTHTLKDFFNYWTELNKSQTKMRFELEKTWELKKRLQRWAKNEKVQAVDHIPPQMANIKNYGK